MRYAGAGRVGLAIAACLAAAACGGDPAGNDPPGDSAKPSPGTSSPSASPSKPAAAACPAPKLRPATANPAPQQAVRVAAQYIAVRESRLSACRPTTKSWKAEAKKLMTPKGWSMPPSPPPEAGRLRAELVKQKWNVRATVSCNTNPEAGPGTATSQPLFCSVKDTTLDASGKPVGTFQVPASWLYSGDRDPALLSMKKQGGTWLVDGDYTGQAQ